METIVFVVYSVEYGYRGDGRDPKIRGVFYTSEEAQYLCREFTANDYTNWVYYWVERKKLTF
jgi:hypothetical protein